MPPSESRTRKNAKTGGRRISRGAKELGGGAPTQRPDARKHWQDPGPYPFKLHDELRVLSGFCDAHGIDPTPLRRCSRPMFRKAIRSAPLAFAEWTGLASLARACLERIHGLLAGEAQVFALNPNADLSVAVWEPLSRFEGAFRYTSLRVLGAVELDDCPSDRREALRWIEKNALFLATEWRALDETHANALGMRGLHTNGKPDAYGRPIDVERETKRAEMALEGFKALEPLVPLVYAAVWKVVGSDFTPAEESDALYFRQHCKDASAVRGKPFDGFDLERVPRITNLWKWLSYKAGMLADKEEGRAARQAEAQQKAVAKESAKGHDKHGFTFAAGQARYKGAELDLPTGRVMDILRMLVDSFGTTITHRALHDQSTDAEASVELREAIRTIRRAFEKCHVPHRVVSKRREGYLLK